MRVNIQGVIMPENFWLENNVAGLDEFKRELAQCADELELYIDSPGGDVFASNTMSTLISEWCLNHPNAKPVARIGGLCASAAANILAKLPSCFSVECFEDTLVMYHSAYAMICGGPEALRDNALLMDLVNSIVIDKLLSKTTLEPMRIKEAFKEGREMWLSGKELKECGLASTLLVEASSKAVINAVYTGNASSASNKSNAEALRYAALINKNIKAKLEAHMAEETKPEVEETEQAKAEVVSEAEENKEEVEAQAECEKEEAKAETETEKEDIDEKVDEQENDEPEEDWEAKAEDLKKECDALKAEVASLKSLVAKYQPTAMPTSQPTASKSDWLAMVGELNAKHLPEQEYAKAYTALKKAHMEEFQAFMNQHSIR